MRFLSYLLTFLTAVLLAACGGGGGSPGLSSGPTPTFVVVAPASVTLQVGMTQQYSIKGGVKPYSVFSNDPAVAVGWIVGDEVLAIGTSKAGSATVTALDAQGTRVNILVSAGSSTAFFTTAPSTLKVAPGEVTATTYRLGGGNPPYTAVSSNPSVVSVVANGNDLTIKALKLDVTGDTTVIVTMTDSSSPKQVLTSTVTVGVMPLAVTPSAYTIFIGDIFRAIITGGTPPYRVFGGIDEAILSARIVNGNQLEAVGGQVAAGVNVTIVDSNNLTTQVTVKISNGQDVLRIQPIALTLPESPSTPDITLMVYGASAAGVPQVFTTDLTLLSPRAPVKNFDGSGYAVTLNGGNTCSLGMSDGQIPPHQISAGPRIVTITVLDAKGKIGTSTITVADTDGLIGCSK